MPNVRIPIFGVDAEKWPRELTIGALMRALFPNGTHYKLTLERPDPTGAIEQEGPREPGVSARTPLPRLLPLSPHEATALSGSDGNMQTINEEFERLLRLASSVKTKKLRNALLPVVRKRLRTLAQSEWRDRQKRLYTLAPMLPADLFAAAGLLLDLSGASHHVLGTMGDSETEPPGRTRPLRFTSRLRREAIEAAREWRKGWQARVRDNIQAFDFCIPGAVQDRWDRLRDTYWDEPVFTRLPVEPADWKDNSTLAWWRDVLFLFVTADEALRNVGFPGIERPRTNRVDTAAEGTVESGAEFYPRLEQYYDLLLGYGRRPKKRYVTGIGTHVRWDALYSISTIPKDLACVLPKSRTAQVGCTLRSLSHNVALLPSQGRARAQWWMFSPQGKGRYKDDQRFPLRSDSEPLNLLLVPYPFEIPNGAMFATHINGDESQQGYGWFKVRSKWTDSFHSTPTPGGTPPPATPEVIYRLVEELAKEAAKATGPIHGIVLPELALSFRDFGVLVDRIKTHTQPGDTFYDIDLIVAGLRSDETGRKGNFAGACIFSRPFVFKSRPGEEVWREAIWSVQEKHHRWRLDRRQIKSYGMGPWLSSGLLWWEDIELLSRSLNIFVFRDCSTVAPLICEDLARLEPIHELVRAIGPNLIIALLMDGPQVPGRWPGRYALGLAEDPGCSVLTLTSFGLVRRANATEKDIRRKSNSVGLWRNDSGDTTELLLDPGRSAIVLSLAGEAVEESTLDGRADGGVSMRWTYVSHTAIGLDDALFPWARAR